MWRSRYFEKKSKGVFAVKKMPKLYKLEYGDLFHNEIRALSHAHIYGVPRVIKYIEAARTTNDICIILEYVWPAFSEAVFKLCTPHICACTCMHLPQSPSFVQVGAWEDTEQAYVFKTCSHSGWLGAANAQSRCAALRRTWPLCVCFMLHFCCCS